MDTASKDTVGSRKRVHTYYEEHIFQGNNQEISCVAIHGGCLTKTQHDVEICTLYSTQHFEKAYVKNPAIKSKSVVN